MGSSEVGQVLAGATGLPARLVGALPAEQTDERTDERTEARRNMGLDVLAEARIQPIPTSAAQTLTA
ncbi:hypothetical protein [Nonomuraea sp. NPDC001699]